MKKIFAILTMMVGGIGFSQMAIGIPQTTNTSISLEFGTENRGIILPWVSSVGNVTNAVDGTMVYSLEDNKVYVKYATGWTDLSIDESGTTVNPLTNVDGALIQLNKTDNVESKVGVGAESETAGILVLENTNQAMVLPKVTSPEINILNPSPGLMVFDPTTKQLAVFNGSVWTFWKP